MDVAFIEKFEPKRGFLKMRFNEISQLGDPNREDARNWELRIGS